MKDQESQGLQRTLAFNRFRMKVNILKLIKSDYQQHQTTQVNKRKQALPHHIVTTPIVHYHHGFSKDPYGTETTQQAGEAPSAKATSKTAAAQSFDDKAFIN